jgi:hypothetical protein
MQTTYQRSVAMGKKNCWEHKSCGREKGGEKAKESGVCPASVKTSVHGIHDGENAGRVCWTIKGTLCCDEPRDTFEERLHYCKDCDFFAKVEAEEEANFIPAKAFRHILK